MEFLAHKRTPNSSPADLLCAAPYRIFELILLLHFSHRSAARRGVPSDSHRASMLVILELLTKDKGQGLLLPLLAAPPSAKSYNFPTVARMLQHAALSLLQSSSPTAVDVRRCCRVLRTLVDAVLASSVGQVCESSAGHTALMRNHVASLLTVLVPIARGSGAGATDAFKLIDHAVRSHQLPLSARAQLQPLPHESPFISLAEWCDIQHAQTALDKALLEFASFSEQELPTHSTRPTPHQPTPFRAVSSSSVHRHSTPPFPTPPAHRPPPIHSPPILHPVQPQSYASLCRPQVSGGALFSRLQRLHSRLLAARDSGELASACVDAQAADASRPGSAVAGAAFAVAHRLLQLCRVQAIT